MAWWLSSDRYMAKACKLKSKSPKHQADAQDWPFIYVTSGTLGTVSTQGIVDAAYSLGVIPMWIKA